MDSNLYSYKVYTLVDITRTDVTAYSKEHEKQRNQQRNWESVLQILGLRAQLFDVKYHSPIEDDVANYSFGINYQGSHRIWSLEFTVEHANLYMVEADRYGALKNDFRLTPIILELDETAKPDVSMFIPSGPFKNIYFIGLKNQ